jgi:hypothetical protein
MMKRHIIHNEKGFVLLVAIIACLILLALGILVINMSTGDLFTTADVVGNKKALAAAESGISKIIRDNDPNRWATDNDYTDCSGIFSYDWLEIDGGTDANTQYAVCIPRVSGLPPMHAAGYNIGGGGSSVIGYAYVRYNTSILGRNTSYNSRSELDIGLGFGPVPMGD